MSSVAKKTLLNETVTASKDGQGVALENYQSNFIFFIKTSNYSAGTFTAKVQHSPNGADWFDLVSFTALTSASSELKFPTTAILGHIRATIVAADTPDSDVLIEAHYSTSK